MATKRKRPRKRHYAITGTDLWEQKVDTESARIGVINVCEQEQPYSNNRTAS
jgi:hypothetical protein